MTKAGKSKTSCWTLVTIMMTPYTCTQTAGPSLAGYHSECHLRQLRNDRDSALSSPHQDPMGSSEDCWKLCAGLSWKTTPKGQCTQSLVPAALEAGRSMHSWRLNGYQTLKYLASLTGVLVPWCVLIPIFSLLLVLAAGLCAASPKEWKAPHKITSTLFHIDVTTVPGT